jgi:GNAT superfamily N-acetyltransferase
MNFLTPTDWPVLRRVRLEALLDSPDAFMSSHAYESRWSELEWRRVFDAATWIVAREAERVIGLAKSVRLPDKPAMRHVESVWVAPTYRRRGVLRALGAGRQSRCTAGVCGTRFRAHWGAPVSADLWTMGAKAEIVHQTVNGLMSRPELHLSRQQKLQPR